MEHKLIAQPKGKKAIKAPLSEEDKAALIADQKQRELKKNKKRDDGLFNYLFNGDS